MMYTKYVVDGPGLAWKSSTGSEMQDHYGESVLLFMYVQLDTPYGVSRPETTLEGWRWLGSGMRKGHVIHFFFFDFLGLPDVIRCWQNYGLNLICLPSSSHLLN